MGSRQLLLVEDSQDDIDLTVRALERVGLGISVDLAHDGVEALEYLLPHPDAVHTPRPLPDVVLLDLKLPKINGLEVLERLRAHPRTKLLPVVVLTSSDHRPDVVSSYSLGCNSYVRKPVDSARFLDIIKQFGLYWFDVNEPVPGISSP